MESRASIGVSVSRGRLQTQRRVRLRERLYILTLQHIRAGQDQTRVQTIRVRLDDGPSCLRSRGDITGLKRRTGSVNRRAWVGHSRDSGALRLFSA